MPQLRVVIAELEKPSFDPQLLRNGSVLRAFLTALTDVHGKRIDFNKDVQNFFFDVKEGDFAIDAREPVLLIEILQFLNLSFEKLIQGTAREQNKQQYTFYPDDKEADRQAKIAAVIELLKEELTTLGETVPEDDGSEDEQKKKDKKTDSEEELAKAAAAALAKSGTTAGQVGVAPDSAEPEGQGGGQISDEGTVSIDDLAGDHAIPFLNQEILRETIVLENLLIQQFEFDDFGVTVFPPILEEYIRAAVAAELQGFDFSTFLTADGTFDRNKLITLRAQLIRKALRRLQQNPFFLSELQIVKDELLEKAVDAENKAKLKPEQAITITLAPLTSSETKTIEQEVENDFAPASIKQKKEEFQRQMSQVFAAETFRDHRVAELLVKKFASEDPHEKKEFELLGIRDELLQQFGDYADIFATLSFLEQKKVVDTLNTQLKAFRKQSWVNKQLGKAQGRLGKKPVVLSHTQINELATEFSASLERQTEQLQNQPISEHNIVAFFQGENLKLIQQLSPEQKRELARHLRKYQIFIGVTAEQLRPEEVKTIQAATQKNEAFERQFHQFLTEHNIDGTSQKSIVQLLDAFVLSGGSVFALQSTFFELQRNAQVLRSEIPILEKKLQRLKPNSAQYQQIATDIAKRQQLFQLVTRYGQLLTTSPEIQEYSEYYVLTTQKKVADLTEAELAQIGAELTPQQLADQVIAVQALIRATDMETTALAMYGSRLDELEFPANSAEAQQVAAALIMQRAMIDEMLTSEQQRAAVANSMMEQYSADQLNSAEFQNSLRSGLNNSFGPGLRLSPADFARLSPADLKKKIEDWKNKLRNFKKIKGDAVRKLAINLGKRVLLPLGAGAVTGWAVSQFISGATQVGATLAGAGTGAIIGGIFGGPVGALIGGALGGIGGYLGSASLAHPAATASVAESAAMGAKNISSVIQDVSSSVVNTAKTTSAELLETVTAPHSSAAATAQLASWSTATALVVPAVGGTIAITAIFLAFMPDASTRNVGFQPGEFSQYLDITKTAVPSAFGNDETRDVEYTVVFTPKKGAEITVTSLTDEITALPPGQPYTYNFTAEQALQEMNAVLIDKPFTTPQTFKYTVTGVSGTDVLLTNTIKAGFTARLEDEEVNETLSASASVRIGNPKLGCFEFGPAGYTFPSPSPVSKEWPEEYKQKVIRAFLNRAGQNATYVNLLCAKGNITLYYLGLSVEKFGGWAPSALSGNVLGLYDHGLMFQDASTEYTLLHELAHIVDYRNPGLRSSYLGSRTTANCYTYPYPERCNESEAFAEGMVLYVIYKTYTFGDRGLVNFKSDHPVDYNWYRNNIFGGQEF